MKQRSPDQTAISVSISRDLLADIDRRAQELKMSRSQFLAQAARINIQQGGPMVIPADPAGAENAGKEAIFMDFFVLALKDYESSKDSTNIEVPDLLAEIEIVQRFQEEIRQIAEHKWNKSREAGRDIGHEQAIRDWLQKHQALWFEAKERVAKEPAGG